MKVFSQSLLAVAMLFGMAAAATSQSAEVPRFADDFSTSALLAELWKTTPPDRWKVADGVLGVSGGGASAAPKGLQVDGPVAVSFRMRVGDFGKGNNWVGANVRGILFSLTPGGFWHVYRSPAQERSLGGIQTTVEQANVLATGETRLSPFLIAIMISNMAAGVVSTARLT